VEYRGRVKKFEDDIKLLMADVGDMDKVEAVEEIWQIYHDLTHSAYEGAIGWILYSKLGFVIQKQMNDVKIIAPSVGDSLEKMKNLYLQINGVEVEKIKRKKRITQCERELMRLNTLPLFKDNAILRNRRRQTILRNEKCRV